MVSKYFVIKYSDTRRDDSSYYTRKTHTKNTTFNRHHNYIPITHPPRQLFPRNQTKTKIRWEKSRQQFFIAFISFFYSWAMGVVILKGRNKTLSSSSGRQTTNRSNSPPLKMADKGLLVGVEFTAICDGRGRNEPTLGAALSGEMWLGVWKWNKKWNFPIRICFNHLRNADILLFVYNQLSQKTIHII